MVVQLPKDMDLRKVEDLLSTITEAEVLHAVEQLFRERAAEVEQQNTDTVEILEGYNIPAKVLESRTGKAAVERLRKAVAALEAAKSRTPRPRGTPKGQLRAATLERIDQILAHPNEKTLSEWAREFEMTPANLNGIRQRWEATEGHEPLQFKSVMSPQIRAKLTELMRGGASVEDIIQKLAA